MLISINIDKQILKFSPILKNQNTHVQQNYAFLRVLWNKTAQELKLLCSNLCMVLVLGIHSIRPTSSELFMEAPSEPVRPVRRRRLAIGTGSDVTDIFSSSSSSSEQGTAKVSDVM